MKLPIKHVVPVVIAAAAVLGQSSTTVEARPRHHVANVQTVTTTPPSFDTQPGAVSTGKAYSRRQARAERRQSRHLARYATNRYATNQVNAGSILSDATPNAAPATTFAGIGGSDLISEGRRYLGGNPTGKASLWCGNFMNLVLKRTGHSVSNSNLARSFASYGTRVSGPQVGSIAVMSRKGGGHVGIVTGVDAKGNIMVLSGNHNRRVAEAPYPASRIFAYVMPK
jgi:uncharacterized protein (TIGR02594 family)